MGSVTTGPGRELAPEPVPVRALASARELAPVTGRCRRGSRRWCGRRCAEQVRRNTHDEDVGAIAAHVRRPEEILARRIDVALRPLRVGVAAAARRIEVGHVRRDHQHLHRAVESIADDLVGAGETRVAGVAAARHLLVERQPGPRVAVRDVPHSRTVPRRTWRRPDDRRPSVMFGPNCQTRTPYGFAAHLSSSPTM